MRSNRPEDPFDVWQYKIFRIVLFILFLVTIYKLLDNELHIGQLVSSWFGD